MQSRYDRDDPHPLTLTPIYGPGTQSMQLLERLSKRFAPADHLAPAEVEEGLTWLHRNGLGSQVMDSLTLGAFLTAFALELGASNAVIGLLAAIPYITQIAQIGGVYLTDRVRNRRLMSVVFTIVSRPMYLLMAAAALVASSSVALALLVVAFTLRYLATAFMASAWNSWVRDLVPEERLGRFISRRLAAMAAIGIVLGLGCAWLIDLWSGRSADTVRYAYAILFVGAFAGGMFSTWCMSRMPEPRIAAVTGDRALLRRLRRPYSDQNYRRLLLFLGSWNFAVNLAAPFFMVHMLKRLELDLSVVIALTLLSQIFNIAVLRFWGTIADRMSNKSVLSVCVPLFVACIFAWTFTTFPEPHRFTMLILVVVHALTGIATAGVVLATGNIALKLAPRGDATAYLANNSLVNSTAAGIAPIIGGLLADFFAERELSLTIHWHSPLGDVVFDTLNVSQWDFFFLLATLVGLYSIRRLARVRETGEVHESMVLSEFYLEAKRIVQNVSSIAGLRQATELPIETAAAPDGDGPAARTASGPVPAPEAGVAPGADSRR